MKKLLLTICLFSTTSIAQTEAFTVESPTISAPLMAPMPRSGIPVIDVAGIAQMAKDALTQANQFKQRMDSVRQQISEAKNQLDEAKRQGEHYKKMVEGYSDLFENALNDPSASRFLANSQWEDIYSHIGDISSLRDKFDLKSDDPIVQKQYDSILKNYAFQEKTYQASVERYNRITKLTSMLKSADTPAKKADLANSIEFERVQLANDNQLIQDMQELMDRQEAIEQKVKEKNNLNKLLM